MNGTCKECQPVKTEGENQDETYLYTYFSDVVNRPEIQDLGKLIQSNVHKTVQTMKKYLLRWKKYKVLWKSDKVRYLKKLFKDYFYLKKKKKSFY